MTRSRARLERALIDVLSTGRSQARAALIVRGMRVPKPLTKATYWLSVDRLVTLKTGRKLESLSDLALTRLLSPAARHALPDAELARMLPALLFGILREDPPLPPSRRAAALTVRGTMGA